LRKEKPTKPKKREKRKEKENEKEKERGEKKRNHTQSYKSGLYPPNYQLILAT